MAYHYHAYGQRPEYASNYAVYSPSPMSGHHDMHEESRMEAPVSPPTMTRTTIGSPHYMGRTGAHAYPPPMPQSPRRFHHPVAQSSYLMAPPSPHYVAPQLSFAMSMGGMSTSSPPASGTATNNTGARRSGVKFLPKRQMGQWHREGDIEYRRIMMAEISKLLQLQNKDRAVTEVWVRKQSQMIKQLEVSLYKSAPSLEAYVDLSTLRQRLQELKEEIKMRSHAEAMLGLQKKASMDCETRGEGQDTSRSEEP